jgi:predicted lipoprotein with Yx(FWY)xxD motif
VKTQTGPLGTYLVDGSGRTLYLFETDTGPISACNGVCAQAWPPLGATGTPQAGAGVTQADLTTTKRADGTMQIDYHNHPLYTFAMDTAAGQTKGQGVNFEGLWWVVAPNGTAITKAATSGTAPSTAPGGGTGY